MARSLLFALLLAISIPLHAGLFGKSPAQAPTDAQREQLPAATIWVDATWGFRKSGAANDLDAAHKAFHAAGHHVAGVQPYSENGDLQGFFVRKTPTTGPRQGVFRHGSTRTTAGQGRQESSNRAIRVDPSGLLPECGDQVRGNVTPVWPWYLPPRSLYEVSHTSSASAWKNSIWATPSLA
jgi:hypothetical protein